MPRTRSITCPSARAHAAAVVKAHVTDRALGVARDAVELHGGIGYTWESDVQIWFKRVLFDRAFLGTPEVHRERSAALAGCRRGVHPAAAALLTLVFFSSGFSALVFETLWFSQAGLTFAAAYRRARSFCRASCGMAVGNGLAARLGTASARRSASTRPSSSRSE
jgi:hypothetical protein